MGSRRDRWFRVYADNGEPTAANPRDGWDDLDDAEEARPYHGKRSAGLDVIREGIVSIGTVVRRG